MKRGQRRDGLHTAAPIYSSFRPVFTPVVPL
jgi:hypothetical protein